MATFQEVFERYQKRAQPGSPSIRIFPLEPGRPRIQALPRPSRLSLSVTSELASSSSARPKSIKRGSAPQHLF